jgi:addiction module HigA family antidote
MAETSSEFHHPGEVLRDEFLIPRGISQARLAKELSLPPSELEAIIHARRSITPDVALRLARSLGTSERFWLQLQVRYELARARALARAAVAIPARRPPAPLAYAS